MADDQNNMFKVEYSTLEHSQRDATIKAFITNLGRYNEGDLVGAWHPFPTTTEEIQANRLHLV